MKNSELCVSLKFQFGSSVRPDLDPSCLTVDTLNQMLFLKEYFEKSIVSKNICRCRPLV